jgi:integrase
MKTTTQDIDKNRKIVRTGSSIAKIVKINNGGYDQFRLTWKVGRKSFRRAFADETKALVEAERITKSLANADGTATRIHGEDITYFLECKKKLGETPLHIAVDFYLKYHGYTIGESKKFGEVGQEFYEDRKNSERNLSSRYLETLKYHIKVLSAAFNGKDIHTINEETITDWLKGAGKKFSLKTKNNYLGTLSAVLRYAKKKKYIGQDEVATAGISLGDPKVTTPGIFTPEELKRIFATAEKDALPYIAIMAFGGSRRAEIEKSVVDQIDLVDGQLRIPPEIAKTNSGRALDLPENLKAWLTLHAKDKGEKVVANKWKATAVSIRAKDHGIVWKQNGLRHSFCSYHLAMHRNAALTSELAGNSPQMLRDHYKAMVSKAAAEEWFAITPDSVREYAKEKGLAELITW